MQLLGSYTALQGPLFLVPCEYKGRPSSCQCVLMRMRRVLRARRHLGGWLARRGVTSFGHADRSVDALHPAPPRTLPRRVW